MERINSVTSSFFRMSNDLQRYLQADRFINYSLLFGLDHFNRAAGRFDLGLGASGNPVNPDFKGYLHTAAAQNHYWIARITQQTGFCHRFWGYIAASRKACKLVQVYFVVLNPPDGRKAFATHKGQPAIKRQVTAL